MDIINLNANFYYDTTSRSCLRRKTDCLCGKYNNILKHKIGDEVGYLGNHGYYSVAVGCTPFLAHRVVWQLFNGDIPKNHHIDHIDGIKTNNRIENLRCITRDKNMRNCNQSVNNSSGVTGVNFKVNTRSNGNSNQYWVASWQDLLGKRREKNFSVTKLGYDEAFRLACEYREKMILALNAQGVGYTERHGK